MLAAKPPTIRPTTARKLLRHRDAETKAAGDGKDGLRFESGPRKRQFLKLLSIANAAKHLDHLPGRGCSIHGIMRGNYSYCDLVPAVLQMIAPATLAYVAITTLGFSRRAAMQILDLIDSRQLAAVDFVAADFFEKAEPETCRYLRESLATRGSRFVHARCHAKVLLMETTDGRWFTSESSANIRACRSIEQFCLTNDRSLFEFHREWIHGLTKSDGQKETSE